MKTASDFISSLVGEIDCDDIIATVSPIESFFKCCVMGTNAGLIVSFMALVPDIGVGGALTIFSVTSFFGDFCVLGTYVVLGRSI